MTEQPILITSIKATEDLPKNYFVSYIGGNCAVDELALGIANADTVVGEECPVSVLGIVLVYSGSAVSIGDHIKSNDDSQAEVSTDRSLDCGVALDSASGADELIRVLLK